VLFDGHDRPDRHGLHLCGNDHPVAACADLLLQDPRRGAASLGTVWVAVHLEAKSSSYVPTDSETGLTTHR
jgi:hypothetical protein